MKADATASNSSHQTVVSPRQHRRATYRKVLDQRKRPIRGLWQRHGQYYAQITIEDQNTGLKGVKRVPLEGATTDAQAVAKFQEMLTQRRKGSLPVLKRTSKFSNPKWRARKRGWHSKAIAEVEETARPPCRP